MTNNKKITSSAKRSKPSIFPLGFGLAATEDGMVIIDFLDEINGERTTIESIALTKKKAEMLIKSLKEAVTECEKHQQ